MAIFSDQTGIQSSATDLNSVTVNMTDQQVNLSGNRYWDGDRFWDNTDFWDAGGEGVIFNNFTDLTGV